MPNIVGNPESKTTIARAKIAAAHGFGIEAHRESYRGCHWTGRQVFYRDGLVEAGLQFSEAVKLTRELEAECEEARVSRARARYAATP